MTKLDPTLQMFKELTDANGIPGNERAPREVMKNTSRHMPMKSKQIT